MNKRRMPPAVLRELDNTGLPYSFENGGRHYKIRLDGRFIGILPRDGSSENYGKGWAIRNCVSQIRRAAKRIKEDGVTCLRG